MILYVTENNLQMFILVITMSNSIVLELMTHLCLTDPCSNFPLSALLFKKKQTHIGTNQDVRPKGVKWHIGLCSILISYD